MSLIKKIHLPLKVGKFEKISKDEFHGYITSHGFNFYDQGKLIDEYNRDFSYTGPRRSTNGSAGYDFKAWIDFVIPAQESIVIPTFIKCKIKTGWMLCMYPRSGMGFKYGVHLANTIGVIDSDYYGCEANDGHIMVKLTNPSKVDITIKQGEKFCQGIFIPFGVTEDDNPVHNERSGGMGSTGK